MVYRVYNSQLGKGNSNAGNGTPDEIYCYRPDGTNTNNGIPQHSPFNNKYLRGKFNGNSNPKPLLFNDYLDNLTISNVYEDDDKIFFTVCSSTQTFIKYPLENEVNISRMPTIV